MKKEIDDVKGKVNKIREAMLALERKEDHPHVVVGVGNTTSLFRSTLL